MAPGGEAVYADDRDGRVTWSSTSATTHGWVFPPGMAPFPLFNVQIREIMFNAERLAATGAADPAHARSHRASRPAVPPEKKQP